MQSFPASLAEIQEWAKLAEIGQPILDKFAKSVSFVGDVAKKESSQLEFDVSPRFYLDRALPSARIDEGRSKFRSLSEELKQIERRFGVDPAILIAIWGIESLYGTRRGDYRVPDVLATLATASKRSEFFCGELISALRIIEAGAVSFDRMRGSWAGAMGHTQFMPSSYLDHAACFEGSGLPDIWGDCPLDALASAASFLKAKGWAGGVAWGFEAVLPASFDFEQTGPGIRKQLRDWNALGLRTACGTERDTAAQWSILLPAGHSGPAFLVGDNFAVIRQYNNSILYALAVGLLAGKIAGMSGPNLRWPPESGHLSRNEVRKVQSMLNRLGHDTGGADGIAGPATAAAVRQFQLSVGRVPDGHADKSLLRYMEGKGLDSGGKS